MSDQPRLRFWFTAGVETEFDWPARETTVAYNGRTFVLRPPTTEAAADIQLENYKDDEGEPPFVLVSRFLSILSWWWRSPARIGLCANTTARPMRIGNRHLSTPPLTDDLNLPTELPIPIDDESKLALALYREAIGVRNPSYELLGYFRILNIKRTEINRSDIVDQW